MYTLILFAVLGGLLSLFGTYVRKNKIEGGSEVDSRKALGKALKKAGLAAVLSANVGAVLAMLLLPHFVPRRDIVGETQTLVAMQNVDGFSGAFVLGSGSINSESYYSFYVRNADGSLSPGRVESNWKVRLVEDKNLTGVGYFTATTSVYDENSKMFWWAVVLDDKPRVKEYLIRVPAGTVVQNFRVQ